MEGQDPVLDGAYGQRQNAKLKCYKAATKRDFPGFALQHGGWCASSSSILATYAKYGAVTRCGRDGEGGPGANDVYLVLEEG